MPTIKMALVSLFLLANVSQRNEIPAAIPAIVALVHPGIVRPYCTGFVVAPGFIVTANHCVHENQFITVRFVTGAEQTMFVLGRGVTDSRDFAVLVGDTRGVEPLELAKEKAKPGTACVTVGYGGGSTTQNATLCGVIPQTSSYLHLAATVIGGDSGSPVMDIETHEVIGIAVRSADPIPDAEAVQAPLVREELEKLFARDPSLFPH